MSIIALSKEIQRYALSKEKQEQSDYGLVDRRNPVTTLGALAPSILLLIVDFLIGDHQLFLILNRGLVHPALDFACTYLSPVLFSVFYVLTLVSLYLSIDRMPKVTGTLSVASGVFSYGLGSLIKLLVMRPRPDALGAARVISEARVIGLWHTSTFSFPSTTTMLAFGLTFPVLLEKRRIGGVLAALSYFLGFAVIYTGFHYPLDVAAGALLASAVACCTSQLRKPLAKIISRYRTRYSDAALIGYFCGL